MLSTVRRLRGPTTRNRRRWGESRRPKRSLPLRHGSVRMVNTNLMGTIRTTKAFIPHFREKRSGLFINTTSIGGLITVPFNSIYHATKWALEGWSESMAFELNQFGIRMKILEPGGMK